MQRKSFFKLLFGGLAGLFVAPKVLPSGERLIDEEAWVLVGQPMRRPVSEAYDDVLKRAIAGDIDAATKIREAVEGSHLIHLTPDKEFLELTVHFDKEEPS